MRWGLDPHDRTLPEGTEKVKGIGVATSSLGVPQSPPRVGGGRARVQCNRKDLGKVNMELGL